LGKVAVQIGIAFLVFFHLSSIKDWVGFSLQAAKILGVAPAAPALPHPQPSRKFYNNVTIFILYPHVSQA